MSEIRRQLLASRVDEPQIAGDLVRQSYCLAPEFVGFSGHFPGYPIVPAVVQILMAQVLAEQFLMDGQAVRSIERAKFHRQLKPLDVIMVSCQRKTVRHKEIIDAKMFIGDELVTDFWLVLDSRDMAAQTAEGV